MGSWSGERETGSVYGALIKRCKYEILCSKYAGPFGFIKPWTAVRDASGGETYSQQFLTPSIIEGIRQKLEVTAIMRHKLLTLVSISNRKWYRLKLGVRKGKLL